MPTRLLATRDEILQLIARLPEAERRALLAELARRYGADAAREPLALGPGGGELEGPADYRVVYDGGSLGNPGAGYGSYVLIAAAGGPMSVVRLDFGERVTNNQAEYDALIAALRDLLGRIDAAGRRPEHFTVEVVGDSQLVLSQVQGTWKSRDPRLRTRRNVVRQLLERFRGYRLSAVPRAEIVRVLGH
jgi:ribonuclease HI